MKENRKKIIIILGIIILPLIYSLFYLGAFWDPYGSLDNMKIAVVNDDNCEGYDECFGDELVDSLKEDGTFEFKVVNSKKANNGLINKDYYAVITIPSDFTSNLSNASSSDRKQTVITYSPNSKTNFLATQIINSAVTRVEKELESQISERIVKELTDNLKQVPSETAKISDGLEQIKNGVEKLSEGTQTLKNGTDTLNIGYSDFDNGIDSINNGSQKLATSYKTFNNGIESAYDGAKTLKEKTNGLNTLVEGVSSLNSGASNLSTQLDSFVSQNNESLNSIKQTYEWIIEYAESHPEIKSDDEFIEVYKNAVKYTTQVAPNTTGVDMLISSSGLLQQGAKNLSTNLNYLNSKTSDLSALKQGIDSLETGLLKIKNGSFEIYNGINSLNTGISKLNSSSSQVQSGISKLNNGADNLLSGEKQLSDGVSSAKEEVDDKVSETKSQTDELDDLDSYAKDSIVMEKDDYGNVSKYGIAFSPYFMSLSLWVGGILILIGLYYDPDHRFKLLGRDSENRGLRVVGYAIIAIIQAIILGFTLKLLLGFEVTNIWLFYGSCILISMSFLSIILFLFITFKDVGKFISLVLLVLQLASCAGTFPIETEPAIYQWLYPYMPMTYSLDLLKESFVSINSEFIVKDVIVLVSLFVIFTALTVFVGMIKTKKEKKLKLEKNKI